MPQQTLSQLCQYHDEAFIEQAFQSILGRPVDPSGKEHYLALLRTAQLSKERIIASLYYSPEGKQQTRIISGIKKYHLLNKLTALINNKHYLAFLEPSIPFIEGVFKLSALNQTHNHYEYSLANQKQDYQEQLNKQQTLWQNEVQQLQQKIAHNHLAMQNLQNKQNNLLSQIEQMTHASPKPPVDSIITTLKEYQQDQQNDFMDQMYIAFEDHFRGSAEQIKQQMEHYLPYIKAVYDSEHGILDIGCGRGEWLQLLKEQQLSAKGIDLNTAMVAQAQQNGLAASHQEAISYLKTLADNSLCAVTGIHLIEHLPFNDMIKLLQETIRVLKVGGVALFETPNPENIFVGAQFFYTDPTHNNPLVPDTMKFIFDYLGYTPVEIKRLHTYAEVSAAKGKPRDMSDNFKNNHFYSAMDFAIIAYKP